MTEYDLVADSESIGELEWMGGRHPELHLQVGDHSAFVGLKRLRPFVLNGRSEGPIVGVTGILHVGSAGQGVVEVGGRQFVRRTSPTGRLEVRDEGGAVALTSPGRAGRRVLVYDRASSNLELPGLLELTLVESFCAIYTARHMFLSMLTAWVRLPSVGTPLATLPSVRPLMLGPG